MTTRHLASSITLLVLTMASPVLADPITIVSNGTGISGLAYAAESGKDELVSHPDAPTLNDSFHLTARVGGTSADASAAITSDLSHPGRLSGNGSTSVSYSTLIGQGEGNVSSHFFVFFELDRPRTFLFDGDFQTSGHMLSTREHDHWSEWFVSLLAMGADGSSREVLAARRNDSTRFVRDGLLAAGLYRFLVQGTSFGATFVPGPASADVFSNFTFSLDLTAHPPEPVPEPASVLLIGTGLGALAAARRRRRRSAGAPR